MSLSEQTQHIAQEASKIAYGGSGVSIGAGIWNWLGNNPSEIGSICAIGGLMVAVATFIVNKRYKRGIREIEQGKLDVMRDERRD